MGCLFFFFFFFSAQLYATCECLYACSVCICERVRRFAILGCVSGHESIQTKVCVSIRIGAFVSFPVCMRFYSCVYTPVRVSGII